jgi:uncharacterized repeat protein (TIGR01451 family)
LSFLPIRRFYRAAGVAGAAFTAAKRARVMRPLSEVFAPGSATLPERLRTLVVSPEREVEPGMTVRATFTFRNQGGAAATGVRLRFNVPDGLVYLVGSGRLDGRELDDESGTSPLLSRTGAAIGDVLAGEERHIEIAYSVAGAIENGTMVELQAAVASFELTPIGSNVVRLVARSKPQLANAMTKIGIESSRDPVPGSQATVTLRIHNAGESTARDVVVVAPVPENTSYVPGSARLNGRDLERELGTPFDRSYAPVVLRSLPARATATLAYRIAIDSPLPGGTPIVARARIASQETPAFSLEPASLTIISAPDFSDERTSLAVNPDTGVQPGQQIALTLTAHNAGTATADSVIARLELPDELLFVTGSPQIDGRPQPHKRKTTLRFDLGRIASGQSLTLRADAIVKAPLADKTSLKAAAHVEWEPAGRASSRQLDCAFDVRAEPAFSPRKNFAARSGGGLLTPGESIEAEIWIENDGAAAAHDGALQLRISPPLPDVAVTQDDASVASSSSREGDAMTIDLGAVAAYAHRRLTVRARVPTPYANGAEVGLDATLQTRELGELPLSPVRWRVESHPAFDVETSRLEIAAGSILRPNQLADVDIVLTNVGTDVAHNVALRCYISPEARLESVEGATRDKSMLLFGELVPAARARARLGLRLMRGLAKDWPVIVDTVLSADGMLPQPLSRVTIATNAEPDFAIGSFVSTPADTVELGEAVQWTLHVRNGGDGTARLVQIEIVQPDSLIYVPNSTTVNDVPIRDAGAAAPFASARGIVINEVDPGVEATISWRTVVHNALPAGTAIAYVAHVKYDGDCDDAITSPELTVRAGPIFENAIPGLPFGLDGMLGPALGAEHRALTHERFVELPPATPIAQGNGTHAIATVSAALVDGDGVEYYDPPRGAESVGTAAIFPVGRLERTARFLREARFGGLITHLFAVRAFLPEQIGDGRCAGLQTLRELLREEFDRLFIKLRLPRYVIAARDIETPSLRSTIEHLVRDAAAAHGIPSESPTAACALRGAFDPADLHEIGERLAGAPLASPMPWSALGRLLPDEPPGFAEYRTLLLEMLDGFEPTEREEFIDALSHASTPRLDEALDALLISVHTLA